MAKLLFDQPGEKYFETGVENGVLYVMEDDATYRDGVAWNGLTNVEESPSGAEETAIYADDMKYLSLRSKEEYGATINAYTYPDAWEECDGSKALVPGFVAGQQGRRAFGFVYKTLIGNDVKGTDYGYKIHIVYNCTASVSSKTHQTVNESPEAVEFSWEVKSTPITVPAIAGLTYSVKPLSTLVIDSTKFAEGQAKTNLETLEATLYGTDPDTTAGTEGTDPTLPTPAEIYAILTATA